MTKRTLHQGIRVCVIEGRNLFVHPRRYALMQSAIHDARDPDIGAYKALKIAGLLEHEINIHGRAGLNIVIDYELAE